MQQEEVSAMNENSTFGVETGASFTPVHDLQRESGQVVQQEKQEEKSSKIGKDQQKKGSVEDPSRQGLPSAKDPTDFLPYRRAVVETDTVLE